MELIGAFLIGLFVGYLAATIVNILAGARYD